MISLRKISKNIDVNLNFDMVSTRLKDNYKEKFYPHYVNSIACEDVCPMGITTQRAISKMNRKTVWKL